MTVIGTGFDDAVFSRGEKPARERMASGDALRDRNAAEAREPVNLVYVGKISRKKGVGSLLDAIALLRDESVAVRCTCVGGHGEAGEYDELAARAASLGGAVEFAGRLPQEELVRVYRAADVFVLPSFYEGLPLVVVEALACGCRVAVSDLPGVRPWLAARVPYAPVAFIDLPRMIGVDEPDPADLPAFAERVKAGILEAASLPPCTLDLSALSWRGLARRVGELLEGARWPRICRRWLWTAIRRRKRVGSILPGASPCAQVVCPARVVDLFLKIEILPVIMSLCVYVCMDTPGRVVKRRRCSEPPFGQDRQSFDRE